MIRTLSSRQAFPRNGSGGAERLRKVVAHIHRNPGAALRLQDLAALAQLSVWHFSAEFRRHMGVTPHQYVTHARVQHAQRLLARGWPPSLAAHECGFYDQSHLSRRMKLACGMTPGQFQASAAQGVRRGGATALLQFPLPSSHPL